MSSPERIGDLGNHQQLQCLPIHLWAAIAKRLTAISDYISFRSVCHSWRSAATFNNFDTEFPRVPWLMYANHRIGEYGILGDDAMTFLDLESRNAKILNYPPIAGIPYLSWSGWILHVLDDSVDISLIHFLRRSVKFKLPGLDTFPAFVHRDGIFDFRYKFYIEKMVLSGSPIVKTDFVVMVIWGDKYQLAFCRPGDSSWTVTDSWNVSFCDIIYHNRKLYAVDTRSMVVECDVHGPNPIELRQVFIVPGFDDVEPYQGLHEYKFTYLAVASSGKFLIVFLYLTVASSVGFRVYEFDLMNGSYREIHHLGNRSLFLGFNSSICLDIPALSNVRPNCIYSTSAFERNEASETPVYDLSTKRFEYLLEASAEVFFPPPTWVVPAF